MARDPNEVVWVVEYQGVPVGTTAIHAINWRDGHGSTGTVIGDKKAWGKGLGRELMQLRARHVQYARIVPDRHADMAVLLSCPKCREEGTQLTGTDAIQVLSDDDELCMAMYWFTDAFGVARNSKRWQF